MSIITKRSSSYHQDSTTMTLDANYYIGDNAVELVNAYGDTLNIPHNAIDALIDLIFDVRADLLARDKAAPATVVKKEKKKRRSRGA